MKNAMQKLAAALVCLAALAVAGSGPYALWRSFHAPAAVAGKPLFAAVTPTDISGVKYPPTNHGPNHLTGGSDAISVVTSSTDGLALGTDKARSTRFYQGPRSFSEYWDDFICGGNGTDGSWTIATTVPFCKLQWRPNIANSATLKIVTTQQDANHGG